MSFFDCFLRYPTYLYNIAVYSSLSRERESIHICYGLKIDYRRKERRNVRENERERELSGAPTRDVEWVPAGSGSSKERKIL